MFSYVNRRKPKIFCHNLGMEVVAVQCISVDSSGWAVTRARMREMRT